MPNMKGDLFISIPSPTLRRAVRQAALDADTPVRLLVTDILVRALSERGYDTAHIGYPQPRKSRDTGKTDAMKTPERASA